jgi:hypothetical protein
VVENEEPRPPRRLSELDKIEIASLRQSEARDAAVYENADRLARAWAMR